MQVIKLAVENTIYVHHKADGVRQVFFADCIKNNLSAKTVSISKSYDSIYTGKEFMLFLDTLRYILTNTQITASEGFYHTELITFHDLKNSHKRIFYNSNLFTSKHFGVDEANIFFSHLKNDNLDIIPVVYTSGATKMVFSYMNSEMYIIVEKLNYKPFLEQILVSDNVIEATFHTHKFYDTALPLSATKLITMRFDINDYGTFYRNF